MQNRRDQVQAHAFVVSRLVSGLLRAEPDAQFSPLRRFVIGTMAGVLLGALALAGFGVYGVFSPGGNKAWKQAGALIVEKETGARYLFVDGQLHPVLNYASARLIIGGEPVIVRASRNSMRGVPHGLPVGIPSAPDYLPDLARLDGSNWQVCSSLHPDANGTDRPRVTVMIGAQPAGRPLGREAALLVRAPDAALYLAWNSHRLRVPAPATLTALGYAAAVPHPVGWAWLNSLPGGPDLTGPAASDAGQPGPDVDGHKTVVGQIFKVGGGAGADAQYFTARRDGFAPVTPLTAALLLGDPAAGKSYPGGVVGALPLTPAGLAAAPRSRDQLINQDVPASPPRLAEVGGGDSPCIGIAMDAVNGPAVRVGLGSVPAADSSIALPSTGDALLADRVVVEPGCGLLIRDQPGPGIPAGALYLLVDNGVRYPIPSDDAAGFLGYKNARPTPVPGLLLRLVPAGPPLDPQAAKLPLPMVASSTRPAAGALPASRALGLTDGAPDG
jgi:type VII secretion protein EccB